MSFKEIPFPNTYTYSSDSQNLPLSFYKMAFSKSISIDFLLGYYSSNAFKVLGESFVEFIENGGSMRLAINHFLSEEDKKLIFDNAYEINQDKIEKIIANFELLFSEVKSDEKLFFDCLRYLIDKKRISFVSIVLKPYKLAHFKEAIYHDGCDFLYTNGSANFTAKGLNENAESFYVHRGWTEDGKQLINERILNFQSIFNKSNDNFIYLEDQSLIAIINKHTEEQSLEKIRAHVDRKKSFLTGESDLLYGDKKRVKFFPRDYQIDAYQAWKKNNYIGLFSMATGTGKTKTALHCLMLEKESRGYCRVVIAVPSKLLVNQWRKEAEDFGFENVFTYELRGWEKKLKKINVNLSLNISSDFIFICSFHTLSSGRIENLLNVKDFDVILIADEAHNLGAPQTRIGISELYGNRLGLSATPSRKYDTLGSDFINKYFKCNDNGYTYNYSLFRAIKNNWLTPYKYYVKFVSLEQDELIEYQEYTKKLLKYFDFTSGEFHADAKNLLIQRKRVIHKARNKRVVLDKLLTEIMAHDQINQTIVYVPEGGDDREDKIFHDDVKKVIDLYSEIISNKGLNTYQIINTSENINNALNNFVSGKIQVLTAMKMLDEGIDIPSIRRAIFCSSTGNPKQFIQRRGRILRKYEGKRFAEVYDMVITPSLEAISDAKILDMELKIFRNELNRVIDFLYASMNVDSYISQSLPEAVQLSDLCDSANLSLVSLIQEKLNNEENT